MSISRHTIDQVKERMDIEDVVSDFVPLKKKGQNLWACCPFHDEKTPSFSVAPHKGIYKCFGCGKAGDSLTFVMDHEGMDYPEAVRYLAKKFGVEIIEEQVSDEQQELQNERESLYILLNFVKDFYHSNLKNSDEGRAIGYSYFKERGYDDNAIDSFDLGYSLDQWDALLKEALAKGYSKELLEKAGLIIKKEEKEYDRFRGRVIFPIHNLSGKVIAFGGRIIKKSERQPKYINSPETELYHKSKVLYGIYQAKKSIRQEENVYLTEGYTDVISLHQVGIGNVVASSGTSLTEEQIKLIKRFTPNITVLFDGDEAGIKASLRGIDMILQQDMNVRALVFPSGEDPDSYSKKLDKEDFKSFLNGAQDFISFKSQLYVETSKDPIARAEAIKEIVRSISIIPDPLKRSIYIKESSEILDLDESVLIAEQNKLLFENKAKKQQALDKPIPEPVEEVSEESRLESRILNSIQLQERESIRLLISYGTNQIEEEYHLYNYLLEELEEVEFTTPIYKEILELFKEKLAEKQVIDAQYLIQNGTEKIKSEVIDLVTERYEVSKKWEEEFQIFIPKEEDILQNVVYNNLMRLKLKVIQKLIRENLEELKLADDMEAVKKYQDIHKKLKKTEMTIASHLGNVTS
ncbi:MAG: DNA primase [Bacteroidota bacterium]